MLRTSFLKDALGEDDNRLKTAVKVAGGVAGIALISYGTYRLIRYFSDGKAGQRRASSSGDGPVQAAEVTGESSPSLPEISLQRALESKEKGNKLFLAKKYESAKRLYTDAINQCPAEEGSSLAVFYQNRAAACDALEQWTAVIQDCNEALSRDERYQKAYSRRGKAKLALHQYEEAVLDTASGYYLQTTKKSQQNLKAYMQAVSEISKIKSHQMIQARTAPLNFGKEAVSSYIVSSPCDPVLSKMETFSKVDGADRRPFHQACSKMMNTEPSEDIVALLTEELKDEESPLRAEALFLRAVVMAVGGCPALAEKDFDSALQLDSLSVRMRSALFLRRGLLNVTTDGNKGLSDLAKAREADPSNPDVYHQSAQIFMLMQNFSQASDDFEKCLEIHKKMGREHTPHVLAHQLACDLQRGQRDPLAVLEELSRLCDRYPSESEIWLIYCQALVFFGKFAEADEGYSKCLKACPDNPKIFIQRAGLLISWTKDIAKAIEYLNIAKKLDPYCEAVHESLGAVLLSDGRIDEALETYKEQLKNSRTIVECQQALCMLESIKAQIHVKEKFGLPAIDNIFLAPQPMPT